MLGYKQIYGVNMENSFYTIEELQKIGFKDVGKNCLISKKASFYGVEKICIGDNVRIDDFCILSGVLEIGNYVHIAAYSALYGGTEGIYVGDFAGVSSRVLIYAISDDYSGECMTNPMIPDEYKKLVSGPVNIGKHVIIGCSSVNMPGVTIGEGCAFGAFSYVNHDPEAWSINVGIPFKKINNRSHHLLELEEQFKKALS